MAGSVVDLLKVHSVAIGRQSEGETGGEEREAGTPIKQKRVDTGLHGGGWCRDGRKEEFIGDTLGSPDQHILRACCMRARVLGVTLRGSPLTSNPKVFRRLQTAAPTWTLGQRDRVKAMTSDARSLLVKEQIAAVVLGIGSPSKRMCPA